MHPGLISVDDHLFEPRNLFDDFGFSGLKDSFPRWDSHLGNPGWKFGSKFYGTSEAAISAGKPWGHRGIFVPASSIPEELSDPVARLNTMDEDGIAVSLCYPSFMGLGGETMSRHVHEVGLDVLLEAVLAYNRWVREVWWATAPSRFIAAGALPLWDTELAAKMVARMAEEGFKAILFPQAPDQIGFPPLWDPYWKPIFRAVEEAGLVLCQHTLSDDMEKYTATNLPPYLPLTLSRTSAIETISSWILTPALDDHPNLRIMVAESGIGWIPWFLELANQSARLHASEFGRMKMLPGERMEKHFGLSILAEPIAFGTIMSLPSGLQDRLMFEADYPHLDGSYPMSRAAFAGLDLPGWIKMGVARGNAIDFFRLANPYSFRVEAVFEADGTITVRKAEVPA